MLACIPCKQAWSLFESGDDYYLFILFWSCTVRATCTASTAPACSACAVCAELHVALSCADMHVLLCLALPLLHACSPCAVFVRLTPRPRL